MHRVRCSYMGSTPRPAGASCAADEPRRAVRKTYDVRASDMGLQLMGGLRVTNYVAHTTKLG